MVRAEKRGGSMAVWAKCVVLCIASAVFAMALGACAGGGVAPRSSLEEYSWNDIAAISQELASCADESQANAVAQKYGLVNGEGKLDGSQTKAVTLADGREFQVRIVGINQDRSSDGSNVGITFMFDGPVDELPMNNDAGLSELEYTPTNIHGGWPACFVRDWLNNDFIALVPNELRQCMRVAIKRSNVSLGNEVISEKGVSELSTEDMVASSEDLLWIPARNEVFAIDDSSRLAVDDPAWARLMREEGAQYKLFADSGIRDGEASELLAEISASPAFEGDHAWWLRSTSTYWFLYVIEDGGTIDRLELPDGYEGELYPPAGAAYGVVPCFAV